MSPTRGRRIALTVGILAIVAVAVAVVVAGDHLLEEWYLWRLSSADETVRLNAAEALGELKSPRAVPELIRLLELSGELPRVFDSPNWSYSYTPPEVGKPARMGPLGHALFRIGPAALPLLLEREKVAPGLGYTSQYIVAAKYRPVEVICTRCSPERPQSRQ